MVTPGSSPPRRVSSPPSSSSSQWRLLQADDLQAAALVEHVAAEAAAWGGGGKGGSDGGDVPAAGTLAEEAVGDPFVSKLFLEQVQGHDCGLSTGSSGFCKKTTLNLESLFFSVWFFACFPVLKRSRRALLTYRT